MKILFPANSSSTLCWAILLIFSSVIAQSRLAAQTATPTADAPAAATTETAPAPAPETNVAVLAGQPAPVAGTPGGPAFAVINLAGAVTPSSVSLQIAPTRGRLVLVGMNERGEMVDLSTTDGVKNLIGDQTLDGTQTSLTFDASKLKVKALMVYFVPETPGQQLTLASVSVFTSQPFTPEPIAPVVVPAPVVPSPAVIQAVSATMSAGAPLATNTATTTSNTSTTTTTTTTTITSTGVPLPPAVLPVSSPTSL